MLKTLIPLVTFAVVAAVMAAQSRSPELEYPEPPEFTLAPPAGWTAQEEGATEAERNMLPADTVLRRVRLKRGDGRWCSVSAVTGGRSKSSIHRPELCLPSQGCLLSEPRTVTAPGGRAWRLLTVEKRGQRASFAYTFFNQSGYHTSSHVCRIFRDVVDRSFRSRLDRWVMVTVFAPGMEAAATVELLGRLEGGLDR